MIYDLIVIGAGMSGISVGHFFRDHRILILERGKIAGEATGKNAGFIIAGFGEHFHRTVERWGLARASEIQQIHLRNHGRIGKLAGDADCDYRQTGSLAVATDEKEKAELIESCRLLREAGFAMEWLPQPDTGLKHALGALLDPQGARMNSLQFWTWLARDLRVIKAEVRSVCSSAGGYAVESTAGTFRSEKVVFCLNAFSSDLVPELKGRYVPLRGQMSEYPLRESEPTDRPMFTKHGDLYWRFTGGTLIFGGLEDTCPDEETGIAHDPSPRIQAAQSEWVRNHFRDRLLVAAPSRSWCGTMAFTVDGFPFVGELKSPGTYVLAGLCGLGHGYAMELAAWLYELIANGKNVVPDYFSSDRIDGLPRYTGGPWRNLYEAWNY